VAGDHARPRLRSLDAPVDRVLARHRVTDGDPGGNFTVDVPVGDDGAVAGAVRATSSRAAAWLPIRTASLVMAA